MGRDRTNLYAALIILVSLVLRVYPTHISGMPFSTDAWPLIRNTERLVKATPTSLGGNPAFDDYNIYWPASQVFAAISSAIIGVEVMDSMRYLFPAASSLTPLLLYLFVRKAVRKLTAFIASMLLAVNGVHAVFTAGVTKETFAHPLLILALYYFLVKGPASAILTQFTLTVAAMIIAHHLASFTFLVIIMNVLIAKLFIADRSQGLLLRKTIMVLIASSILVGYYIFYALSGLKTPISFEEIISVASFQIISFTSILYVFVRPKPRRIPNLWIALILLVVTLLAANHYVGILPGSPSIEGILLPFSAINVLIAILAIIGVYAMKDLQLDEAMLPFVFWASAIIGLEAYALFGSPPEISLTLSYRLYNFLFPPVVVISSLGLLWLASKSSKTKYPVILSVVIPTTILLATFSYSAVIGQENFTGYQWLYTKEEFAQTLWVKKYGNGLTVYADAKINYLLEDYMGVNVNVAEGYSHLTELKPDNGQSVIMTYKLMWKNGYVIGPYGRLLPDNLREKLEQTHNIIYSDTDNSIYVG